jgi:predicted nucleic acid-binding protein
LIAIIDTNIAIHSRERNAEILQRLTSLPGPPLLSIVSQVELEGGVATPFSDVAARRRASLDELLAELQILDFDGACAAAYTRIIAVTGHSRPRTLDRMIAATALAHNAALITINGQHFRDIPGLDLIEWPSPTAA